MEATEMKKIYITPQSEIEVAFVETLQAASGVKGKINGSLDIGWGGTDKDGDLDPSANGYGMEWDDDDWDKL